MCSLLFVRGIGQEYRIVDTESRESLPYATILFPQALTGLYADRDGLFVMPDGYTAADTISISMLGYTSLYIKISDLTDTIFLTRAAYNLQSIVVTPNKKRKNTTVGFISSRRGSSWGSKVGFVPTRIVTYIANKSGSSHEVDKLLYRHEQRDQNIRFIARSQVYSVNSDGTPGAPLLNKSNIITLSGKGILEVSCEEALIFPPEGLFVGIEIIEAIDNKGESINPDELTFPIVLTSRHKEINTYFSVKLAKWISYFTVSKHTNAMIGLSYK